MNPRHGAGRAFATTYSSQSYCAREASGLWCVSHDTLTSCFPAVLVSRHGATLLFRRWSIDHLVADPDTSDRADEAVQPPSAGREQDVLPPPNPDELCKVTRTALAREAA